MREGHAGRQCLLLWRGARSGDTELVTKSCGPGARPAVALPGLCHTAVLLATAAHTGCGQVSQRLAELPREAPAC